MGHSRIACTLTAPVVDHGSWIANSRYGLRVAVLCGVRLRVAVLYGRGLLAVLGCEFVIWVAGGRGSLAVLCGAGLRVAVSVFGLASYGAGWLFCRGVGFWVQRWRDRDERQRREMRDRGERVR